MIPNQRHLFDLPDDVAYLNCAYAGPMPRAAVAAGEQAARAKATPWTMSPADFFEPPDRVRALAGDVLGVRGSDIAIVPAASYGLAVAAKNLPLSADQTVVVLQDQFPSNVYVWRTKAQEVGARVHAVARPPLGEDGSWRGWTQPVLEAIGPETAIVALPHCHWSDGGVLDLERISDRCREVGAALVLDLSQSAGVLPLDLRRVDPDFVVTVGYKWLMGPYGLALLYVAPRHQGGRPLEETWFARRGAHDFARLVDYQDAYADGAVRFDMGERAQFHLMPMLAATLKQVVAWSVPAIHQTLRARNQPLVDALRALGAILPPDDTRAPHYLAITLPARTPADLAERLQAANVSVSFRGTSMRVTPHVYNTQRDLDRFLSVMSDALR